MNQFCESRVWDNGDMTDCGIGPITGVNLERRPACAKHSVTKRASVKRVKASIVDHCIACHWDTGKIKEITLGYKKILICEECAADMVEVLLRETLKK